MGSQLAFVIPGWYKYKHNTGDTTQTIRVMGGGDRGNDYFALMDGREMHEHEILDSWEYMPTAMSQDGNEERFAMGDLTTNKNTVDQVTIYDEINNSNNNQESFIDYQEEVKRQIVEKSKDIQNISQSEFIQVNKAIIISDEEIFIDQLLKQISGERDKENKGAVQFKETFEIPIKFNFKYDLNKLRQILLLINSDEKKINLLVEKIISNDLNDIKNKINEAVKGFLLNDANTIKQITHEKEIQPNVVNVSPKIDLSKYLDKKF